MHVALESPDQPEVISLIAELDAYQDVDIDSKSGMAAFAQVGGGRGIPLLLADGQRVQGFSPAAYDALFVKQK